MYRRFAAASTDFPICLLYLRIVGMQVLGFGQALGIVNDVQQVTLELQRLFLLFLLLIVVQLLCPPETGQERPEQKTALYETLVWRNSG